MNYQMQPVLPGYDSETRAYISKPAWRSLFDALSHKKYCLHVLIAIICKINPLDPTTTKGVSLDLKELKANMGLEGNNALTNLRLALKAIASTAIEFENEKGWHVTSFISDAHIPHNGSTVEVNICDSFINHLSDLKYFVELKARILSASTRSIIFYQALKFIHSKQITTITPEELAACCKTNFSRYADFKKNYMLPCLKELSSMGILIEFEETRQGKKVLSLAFNIIEDKILSEVKPITQENTQVSEKNEGSDELKKIVKKTAPRAKSKDNRVLEIFNYFNKKIEEKINASRKLRVLDNPREKAIKDLLERGSLEEAQLAIDGFIEARLDGDPKYMDYIDFNYITRRYETYVNLGNSLMLSKVEASMPQIITPTKILTDEEKLMKEGSDPSLQSKYWHGGKWDFTPRQKKAFSLASNKTIEELWPESENPKLKKILSK